MKSSTCVQGDDCLDMSRQQQTCSLYIAFFYNDIGRQHTVCTAPLAAYIHSMWSE